MPITLNQAIPVLDIILRNSTEKHTQGLPCKVKNWKQPNVHQKNGK